MRAAKQDLAVGLFAMLLIAACGSSARAVDLKKPVGIVMKEVGRFLVDVGKDKVLDPKQLRNGGRDGENWLSSLLSNFWTWVLVAGMILWGIGSYICDQEEKNLQEIPMPLPTKLPKPNRRE